MKKFGLIGFPLTHSFSKNYFTKKFLQEKIDNVVYENYEIDSIDQLENILKISNLKGLNITIPYKEKVLSYLDEIDSVAKEIGAVNTIKLIAGKVIGFNTDVFGFSISLIKFLPSKPLQALVLGTGGSSKAVAYSLQKLEIPFQFVSRNKKKDCLVYEEITEKVLAKNLLIINTTPLGMFPNMENCPPIPYSLLTPNHYLFDLIYNPAETLFLQKGKAQGAAIKNGLEMLETQAEKSWEIWNGK